MVDSLYNRIIGDFRYNSKFILYGEQGFSVVGMGIRWRSGIVGWILVYHPVWQGRIILAVAVDPAHDLVRSISEL